MAVLHASHIEVLFAGTTVLDGATLTINPNEKVGLIGANGSGKTTLVRVLTGALEPDRGTVERPHGTGSRIAYVPQQFPTNRTETAGRFPAARVLAVRDELQRLEEAMGATDPGDLPGILSRYGTLRERYDELDGDRAEERASALLEQMNLSHAAHTPVQQLSGGEKNRLQIAEALIDRPDVLILDEPGNHLDAWGLAWLEELLRDYPAAVLIISHNRYLLDRVVNRVLYLKNGTLTSWSGNYSAFKGAQLRQAVATARDARADKQHLERLEAMVDRLAQLARSKPDPAIGRRLRARRTQLERARKEARERPDLTEGTAAIRLNAQPVRSDVALELVDYTLRVPGTGEDRRVLLEDAGARVAAGERVALVGPNGCGKTTLLRTIVTEGRWDDPHVRVGPSMKIGYCSQHQDIFSPADTVEENLARLAAWGRDRIFGLVSRYLFTYEDLDRAVATLSGGELNRLQIARAELLGANFLILDEPTNHLDIPSREVVEEAVRSFRGTVLVVSHDRYFLDTLVNRVLAFHDRELVDFPGGFSEYWFHMGRFQGSPTANPGRNGREPRGKSGVTSGPTVAHGTPRAPGTPDTRGTPGAPGRQPSVEDRLLALEAEKVEIERRLRATYDRDNLAEAARLSARLEKVTRLYDRLYEEWE